jgi:hypothetical protein
MNNSKVTLYQWNINTDHPQDFIDIDWPLVHKECGLDHIDWINRQDPEKCQMTLEIFTAGRRLVVEFFDKELEKFYHLMWAK